MSNDMGHQSIEVDKVAEALNKMVERIRILEDQVAELKKRLAEREKQVLTAADSALSGKATRGQTDFARDL